MRVLAIVHKYPPEHNAGAEWMLHSILRTFIDADDACTVIYPTDASRAVLGPRALDGVGIYNHVPDDAIRLARKYDIIVTHLDQTAEATRIATAARKPLVHLVHNDAQLRMHKVDEQADDQLVAFNSRWIARTVGWSGPSVICRPLVICADYTTEHVDSMTTMLNMSRAKGSSTFYALAQSMRDRHFLGVKGAYGNQDVQRAHRFRNVEIIDNTPNVRDDVYARTRVLLMPSHYESWGRCAIEAAASGVPTVAAPTPGLVEALDDAGIFCDVRRTRDWSNVLHCLDDPDEYAHHSTLARERATTLERTARTDVAELRERMVDMTRPARKRAQPAPARVAVIVPVAGDTDFDDERGRSAQFVLDRYRAEHPDWSSIIAPGPNMDAWCKAEAIGWGVETLRRLEASDVLVVADADVFINPDALRAAVTGVVESQRRPDAAAGRWAVPFTWVHRLNRDISRIVLDTGHLPERPILEHQPRRAVIGGGMVVLPAAMYRDTPLDRRFIGWGGEDESWGHALSCLHGEPARVEGPLFHLWHPPTVDRRSQPARPSSVTMLDRYRKAQRDPEMMRALVDEITRPAG